MAEINESHVPDDPTDSSLEEALGLRKAFLPDDAAPPLDLDLLKRYVRGELAEAQASEVDRLAASFRTWHEGLLAAIEEDELA